MSVAKVKQLKKELKGEFFTDRAHKLMYATDASIYRELPIAVAFPKDNEDIRKLILFAYENNIPLIPRTAGTSLAGQVVGKAVIVDVSRFLNNVLEINKEERTAWVQPGVIPDELNKFLKPYGLFFAPETSTSNRCMIGGMVGNNSCGAHSLIYGSTREHVLEIKGFLSNGSEVHFKALNNSDFEAKCKGDSLENELYRNIYSILSDNSNVEEIIREYPDKDLKRRNTGYAIDVLLESAPFTKNGEDFNFCRLLCGSEGTLAFFTEIKINLIPLPPPETALLCVHFRTLDEALRANLIALKYKPDSIELIDNVIIECTKDNLSQRNNRFFIKDNPAAILIIEWARDTKEEIIYTAAELEKEMKVVGFGYHFPLVTGKDQQKIWNLRKAGLGMLTNIPGDAKPTGLIEDTAVKPEFLPDYIAEIKQMLANYRLNCVYYAHIATGELHMKPVLNLKQQADYDILHKVAYDTALLVKKYKGSLSGEHGDGRLRAPFIPMMIGRRNYGLLCQIKQTWDPKNIFNPGKIISNISMYSSLRYSPGQITREIKTWFDYSSTFGLIRALEQCNGSSDCRKPLSMGGVMCPTYKATLNEKDSTRARVNLLREFLSDHGQINPFDHKELFDVLDLCLACKGCKTECPSGIDMARYKAEFLQQYYNSNFISLRTYFIANIIFFYKLLQPLKIIYNKLVKIRLLSRFVKFCLGFAQKRDLPSLSKTTLKKWYKRNFNKKDGQLIYLFADEFTNYADAEIGIKALKLLKALGYNPVIPRHSQSGRSYISKGFLQKARKYAEKNVRDLSLLVDEQKPLIGIEPGAILCFRDEYPDLVRDKYRKTAKLLSVNCLTFEEFISREFKNGNIRADMFTENDCKIRLHGHCFQKAITTMCPTVNALEIPVNFKVDEIESGCCGMAGSFGYEKEHYDISVKIGEMVLFPEIRNSSDDEIIVAPGTSCRQHIKENTGIIALHPAELLFDSLAVKNILQ